MSRRLPLLLLASWLITPALGLAGELSPEELARIRRAEKAAMEKVNEAHGNKKSSEMSAQERRQVIQEQQEAVRKVLDENGVSDKDYARQSARLGPKGNAAVAAAEKELEAKEKAAKEKAARKAAEGPEEIPIQQGFSEKNPVDLESSPDAAPLVEQGLPVEESAEEAPKEELTIPLNLKGKRGSRGGGRRR